MRSLPPDSASLCAASFPGAILAQPLPCLCWDDGSPVEGESGWWERAVLEPESETWGPVWRHPLTVRVRVGPVVSLTFSGFVCSMGRRMPFLWGN